MTYHSRDKNGIAEKYYKLMDFVIGKLHLNKDKYLDVAMIGLTNAINTYDESKGKETTYFYRCIRNELRKALYSESMQKRKTDKPIISLDKELISCEGRITTIEELIPDERVDVELDVENNLRNEALYEAIDSLRPEYKEIITNLFGIKKPIILASEYARKKGVTTQCIYQKRESALRELRSKMQKWR